MNKLWLIIKREYLSRVTRRAFILGTILTPLGIGALIFVNIKLATYKDDNFKNIAVRDESNILTQAPENQQNIHFKSWRKNTMVFWLSRPSLTRCRESLRSNIILTTNSAVI
jgi:hypothetical protein